MSNLISFRKIFLAFTSINLLCLLGGPAALGFSKSATFSALGGFNDNTDLQADGDPEKESSLFGRARVSALLDWKTGRADDRFYVNLHNDDVLYLTDGESSSVFLSAAPGFRFETLAGRLITDVGLHLLINTAFDDSDGIDDARTSNVRSTHPQMGNTDPPTQGSPASFIAQEFTLRSLYDLSSVSVGPVFRYANISYSKVPQDDQLLVFGGEVDIPFTKNVEGRIQLALLNNDSDITGAGYSGHLMKLHLLCNLSSGFAIDTSYQYQSRDYESPSTRDDDMHFLRFLLTKELSRSTRFEFSFDRISNNSSTSGAKYGANIVQAGLQWDIL